MSPLHLVEWLASTPGSIALHESRYMFLVVLTVHVMTLCVFIGMALMVDLRLMGVALARVPVSEVVERLLPWTVAGFLVMVASGSLLFYSAPLVRYRNVFFWMKMVMLGLAGANAVLFHRRIYPSVAQWDRDPVPPKRARVAGGVSLALWVAIILAGRTMAYQDYWFHCDIQPQTAFVNWLLGCEDPAR
jgi:hypothetical protein